MTNHPNRSKRKQRAFDRWQERLAEAHGLSYQLTSAWLHDNKITEPRDLSFNEKRELIRIARI